MRTFYQIFVRWKNEIRVHTLESPLCETPEEVRFQIAQFVSGQSLYRVYRCEADEETMRDVTDDFIEGKEPYNPVYELTEIAAEAAE